MSIWILVVACWVFGSLPLAVLVGKVLARSGSPDEITLDVDAFLRQVFPADAISGVDPA